MCQAVAIKRKAFFRIGLETLDKYVQVKKFLMSW
jgi:hypothetical protein